MLFLVILFLCSVVIFSFALEIKNIEQRVFSLVVVGVVTIVVAGYIIIKSNDKAALDRATEKAASDNYVEANYYHILIQNNRLNRVFIAYSFYVTKEERDNFSMDISPSLNYPSRMFAIEGRTSSLNYSITPTPIMVKDSFLLPENFYIRIKDKELDQIQCIDHVEFFKIAKYNEIKNRWEIEIN